MSASTQLSEIWDMRLVRAISYSSYTLLVWDYLLTLDDEITYIWDSPPSVMKYLFIGNRYMTLLVQPVYLSQVAGILLFDSSATCLAFSWGMGLAQFGSDSAVHIQVLLRVWILYGRTRTITVALIAAFTLYICASMTLLAYIIDNLNSTSAGTCVGELAPFSWLIWFMGFLLEMCLFGMTIFMFRRQKSTAEFSRISRLLRSLYRHAIIFFMANTFCNTLNIIAWTVFAGTPLFGIAIAFTVALVNITGQRLAIDLRRLHIQKDVTESEVSREVAVQLAVFDSSDPVVP
ncbi:hypothetical protein HD554DRAFT_358052 [Boletus coccyginus]|nr:hypothetical protein HD554DRAFT_358052 [Boletus coccyginus]